MELSKATGTLVDLGPDTVLATVEGRDFRLPLTSIDVLEVRTGRHGHTARGMAIGGLVGIAAAAGASLVNTSGGFLSSDGEAVIAIQVLAIPAGVVIGGILGAFIRGDTWTELSLGDDARSGGASP